MKTIDEVLAGGNTANQLRERYAEICAVHDAVLAQIAPFKAELEQANAEVERAQAKANALAARINEMRGGDKWVQLKRERGILAKALSGKQL